MLKRSLSVEPPTASDNGDKKKPRHMETTPPSQSSSDEDDASDESSVWAPSDCDAVECGDEVCEDGVGCVTYCTRSRGLLTQPTEEMRIAMDKVDEVVNNESDLSSDTESGTDAEEDEDEDSSEHEDEDEDESDEDDDDEYSDDDSFVTSDEDDDIAPKVDISDDLPATLIRCDAGIDPCVDGESSCPAP